MITSLIISINTACRANKEITKIAIKSQKLPMTNPNKN